MSAKVEEISAPRKQTQRKSRTPALAETRGRSFARAGLIWIAIAGSAAASLGIFLYLRRAPAPLVFTRPQASAETPSTTPLVVPSIPVPTPARVPALQEAVAPSPPPAPALSAKSASAPVPQQLGSKALVPPIAEPLPAATSSAPEQRPQIAAAPDSGFLYPVVSNPALSGKVDLRAVIGADGTVKQVDVLSGNRALASAAVRAVRHWRYRPHEVDGRAVEAVTNIAIRFAGDDAVSISFPAPH